MGEGLLEEQIIIDSEVIDKERVAAREADYLTRAGWKDPSPMRYFDFSGNEISPEEAKSSEEQVIGEVLQYDWLIGLADEKRLRQATDIFKRYASRFQLDAQGRVIIARGDPQENAEAVSGA